LLVFDPKIQQYYLFENYKQRKDNRLRPAQIVQSSNATLWSAGETGYRLYVNGESINARTKNEWRDDDLLVFDPKIQQYYLFENYKQRKDNRLRPAIIINQ
jgi:hypothetical protein